MKFEIDLDAILACLFAIVVLTLIICVTYAKTM